MTSENISLREGLFVPLEPVVLISGSNLLVNKALTPCSLHCTFNKQDQ